MFWRKTSNHEVFSGAIPILDISMLCSSGDWIRPQTNPKAAPQPQFRGGENGKNTAELQNAFPWLRNKRSMKRNSFSPSERKKRFKSSCAMRRYLSFDDMETKELPHLLLQKLMVSRLFESAGRSLILGEDTHNHAVVI